MGRYSLASVALPDDITGLDAARRFRRTERIQLVREAGPDFPYRTADTVLVVLIPRPSIAHLRLRISIRVVPHSQALRCQAVYHLALSGLGCSRFVALGESSLATTAPEGFQ